MKAKMLLNWCAVLWILTASAGATEYYVRQPHGSDMNGGTTIPTAFLTIQKCADTVSPAGGDTCNILPAVYFENVVFKGSSGTSAPLTTYKAYTALGSGVVQIGGSSPSIPGNLSAFSNSHNVRLEGLTFSGASGTNPCLQATGKTNIQFVNLEIHHCNYAGITITDSTDVLMQNIYSHNNVLYNSSPTGADTGDIYINTGNTNVTIEDSDIADQSGGFGIILYGPAPTGSVGVGPESPARTFQTDNVIIRNNTIRNGKYQGLWIANVHHVLAEDNEIFSHSATGIQVEQGARWVYLRRNITHDNAEVNFGEAGIWFDETVWGVAEDNEIYRNGRCINVTQSHRIIVRRNRCYSNKGQNQSGGAATNQLITALLQSMGGSVNPGTTPGATNNSYVHNTFYDNGITNGESGCVISLDGHDGPGNGVPGFPDGVLNNIFLNNICSMSPTLREWQEEQTNDFEAANSNYNLYFNTRALSYRVANTNYTLSGYQAATGRDVNSLTGDPLFVSPTTGNFELNSGSPAINAGRFLTTAVGAGTGSTSLIVQNARPFTYGLNVTTGDVIQFSSGGTRTITAINYTTNTLTLNSAASWASGVGISYPYSGTAPDMGALESDVPLPADTWRSLEDFDAYAENVNLENQNGGTAWARAWTDNSVPRDSDCAKVKTVPGFSGRAVETLGTEDCHYYREFVPINAGQGHVLMQADAATGMPGQCEISFYAAGTTRIGEIRFFNGSIQVRTDAGYTTVQSYIAHAIHDVGWEFDDVGQNNKYRITVDGGTPSAWVNTMIPYTVIDTIQLGNSASTTNCYWDVIDDGATAPPSGGGTITISSPVVGDVFTTSNMPLVAWSFQDFTGNVDIQVSRKGASGTFVTVATVDAGSSPYQISANSLATTDNLVIKVCRPVNCALFFDNSDTVVVKGSYLPGATQ